METFFAETMAMRNPASWEVTVGAPTQLHCCFVYREHEETAQDSWAEKWKGHTSPLPHQLEITH